jgi:hypothetical protein
VTLWVAETGGTIIGAVSAHASPLLSRDTRICRITAMIVTADAQGRGVGGAHAFYARLGYDIKPHRFIKNVSVL